MARSLNTDRQIILVAHNIRSTHNVGSLFRTAEGLGIKELLLSGYTPYPSEPNDSRLAHIVNKLDKQIEKTALGAVRSLKWRHTDDIAGELSKLKRAGYQVLALEQSLSGQQINKFEPNKLTVLVIGNEVEGLDQTTLKLCDKVIEIPMLGKKESFNVVQAAAMALFYLRISK